MTDETFRKLKRQDDDIRRQIIDITQKKSPAKRIMEGEEGETRHNIS